MALERVVQWSPRSSWSHRPVVPLGLVMLTPLAPPQAPSLVLHSPGQQLREVTFHCFHSNESRYNVSLKVGPEIDSAEVASEVDALIQHADCTCSFHWAVRKAGALEVAERLSDLLTNSSSSLDLDQQAGLLCEFDCSFYVPSVCHLSNDETFWALTFLISLSL